MAAATIQPQSLDYIPSGKHHEDLFNFEQVNAIQTKHALPGFPAVYTGDRVWIGSEMALKQDEWMITLSIEDKDQILKALRHFQALNVSPGLLSPETFPLPQKLSERLRQISHACYNGRGFAILRGLCPEDFTEEENVLVFGGVSSHVASRRGFQHKDRELVTCHVYSDDLKPGAKEHNIKPAFTNGRLAFHTDLGDILTLYAREVSATGGETMLVSSSQLYNELSATRPDLLQEFAEKWTFAMSQDYATNATPLVTNAPGNRLVFQYSRLPVTGFRTSGPNPTQPAPSSTRVEAMALLEALAWKRSFALPRQPGDIAFINNLCLMHARKEFDVDAGSNPLPSKRRLVKLMLMDPLLAWELPEEWRWCREMIYGENDGVAGGERKGRRERWELSVGGRKGEGTVWAGEGSYANG